MLNTTFSVRNQIKQTHTLMYCVIEGISNHVNNVSFPLDERMSENNYLFVPVRYVA